MARTGRVQVDITADASGVSRGARQAEGALARLNRAGSTSLRGLGKAGIAAGAALGTGLAAAVVFGTNELLEQEKASAQTEARLKSTGNAANVTAAEIENLASKLQAQSGVADDVIQGGENMLLTFTNIRNEVGKGNAIFDRATQASLDLSVAFGKDLQGSALMVGKALNDPIKGITALGRAGVQFTAAQKEQITALTESGHRMEAQKIILRELETQVGGSAKAFGGTMAGQVEKAKRQLEDFAEGIAAKVLPIVVKVVQWISDHWPEIERVTRETFRRVLAAIQPVIKWIQVNIVPTIKAIVDDARALWARFGGNVKDTFRVIMSVVKPAMMTVRSIIETVLALIRGDWSGVWKGLRGIVVNAFGTIWAFLKGVPAQAARNVAAIGTAMGKSIANGMITMVNKAIGWINSGLSFTIPGPGPLPDLKVDAPDIPQLPLVRRAGGDVPGPLGRAVPIIAHAGEVVLNPQQQRIIGADLIRGVLAQTGGVLGGRQFASGGYVTDALARAKSNLNEPYGKPSRGQSRTGPGSWDCSGYATMIAGVNVGGTTVSAYGASTSVRDHERYPIVWGFRKTHAGAYRGGYDEHMGVRVGGTWFQTSGGRTAQTGADGDWQEIRVPKGLERLSSQDGDGPGGEQARGNPSLTPVQRLSRALGRAGVANPTTAAAGIMRAGTGDVSYSGLSDADERQVRAIGRKAGTVGGQDARDEAERQARLGLLRRDVSRITDKIQALQARRATLSRQRNAIAKRRGMKAADRARAIAALNAAIRRLSSQIVGWKAARAGVQDEIAELGYTPAVIEDGEGATGSTGDTGAAAGADAGISPDAQAQIDQANAARDAAERNSAGNAAWLRTLFGSGSIDPGSGSVNVTIQALHPGDPAIQAEVARWVVGALGGQGSVPATRVSSAA